MVRRPRTPTGWFTTGALLLLALALGGAPRAAADGPQASGSPADDARPSAAASDVAAQLVHLNMTLGRIQEVLDRLTVHQELDLLMKRIDLKVSRVEPLRRRVRDTEVAIESTEDEIERMEMFRSQEEETAANEDATQEVRDGAERSVREIENMIELQQTRLETLRLRLIELENDLAVNQQEIEFLEEALDERLGLR